MGRGARVSSILAFMPQGSVDLVPTNAPRDRMLKVLEPLFFQLTQREYDIELSTSLLGIVIRAYETSELDNFQALMDSFVASSNEKLRTLYAHWSAETSEQKLLFQPETLAIFERLDTNLPAIRDAWEQLYLRTCLRVWRCGGAQCYRIPAI